MMKKIKIRYNLQRGENWKKWKIERGGKIEYLSPDENNLILENCILKNNEKKAKKIYEGAAKEVCAWIICERLTVTKAEQNVSDGINIRYNPRISTNWMMGGYLLHNNSRIDKIVAVSNKLYAIPK